MSKGTLHLAKCPVFLWQVAQTFTAFDTGPSMCRKASSLPMSLLMVCHAFASCPMNRPAWSPWHTPLHAAMQSTLLMTADLRNLHNSQCRVATWPSHQVSYLLPHARVIYCRTFTNSCACSDRLPPPPPPLALVHDLSPLCAPLTTCLHGLIWPSFCS